MSTKFFVLLIATSLAFSASAKQHQPHHTPPPPPAAPGYYAPAPTLDSGDFNRIVKLVKKQSFDDGKLNMVEAISLLGYFSSEQCEQLLKTFSFDDGRLKALKLLAPRITDPGRAMTILKPFTFDSNRKKAIDFLDRHYRYPPTIERSCQEKQFLSAFLYFMSRIYSLVSCYALY